MTVLTSGLDPRGRGNGDDNGADPLSGPDAPASDATPGTDPASAAASRRAALMRSGLIVAVLFVVFVIILPATGVNYSEVFGALNALSLQQMVVITALGAAGWLVSGLVICALIPGLSVPRGPTSWLILSGIGASVPFGPWNIGVLWVVLRGWGIPNIPATSGIALYGVVHELSRPFLPLFAIITIAVTGDLAGSANAGKAWTIAIISAVVFIVAVGLIIAVVRSERIAAWLGRTGQRMVSWLIARLGRKARPTSTARSIGSATSWVSSSASAVWWRSARRSFSSSCGRSSSSSRSGCAGCQPTS